MGPDGSEATSKNPLEKTKLLSIELPIGVTSLENKTSETNWPSIREVVQRRDYSTTRHHEGKIDKVRDRCLIDKIFPRIIF